MKAIEWPAWVCTVSSAHPLVILYQIHENYEEATYLILSIRVLYLILALSFGDVLSSDFYLRCHQTLQQVGAVETQQERDFFRLCNKPIVIYYLSLFSAGRLLCLCASTVMCRVRSTCNTCRTSTLYWSLCKISALYIREAAEDADSPKLTWSRGRGRGRGQNSSSIQPSPPDRDSSGVYDLRLPRPLPRSPLWERCPNKKAGLVLCSLYRCSTSGLSFSLNQIGAYLRKVIIYFYCF